MTEDERLVPLEPRGGAAVGTGDDDLARREAQGPPALRAADRFDELRHADGMLMAWSNIAILWEASGPFDAGAGSPSCSSSRCCPCSSSRSSSSSTTSSRAGHSQPLSRSSRKLHDH